MNQLLKLPEHQKESGFTLIEILVVVLIIGILAAVAIPVFLNQRKVANDAAAVSEAHNIAQAMETYITNNPKATYFPAADIRAMVKQTPNVGALISGTPNDYCVQTWSGNGKQYRNDNDWTNGRPYYVYSNKSGGDTMNSGSNPGLSGMSCFTSASNLWAP